MIIGCGDVLYFYDDRVNKTVKKYDMPKSNCIKLENN